jgi:undecaprenyl-phosphate 4-deoxy-4-formamido-L-arabinose transferase
MWGITVEGFTSTIIAITLLSGVQLVSLGLIGECLGRLHINSNAKPQFNIRSLTRFTGGEEE